MLHNQSLHCLLHMKWGAVSLILKEMWFSVLHDSYHNAKMHIIYNYDFFVWSACLECCQIAGHGIISDLCFWVSCTEELHSLSAVNCLKWGCAFKEIYVYILSQKYYIQHISTAVFQLVTRRGVDKNPGSIDSGTSWKIHRREDMDTLFGGGVWNPISGGVRQ